MDWDLKEFLNIWGQPTQRIKADEGVLRQLAGKVPSNLIDYWRELGFSVFKDGLLCLCNPLEWKPVVDEWIEGTELETLDAYIPLMKGPFGDIGLFGLRYGSSAKLFPLSGALMGDRDLPKCSKEISIGTKFSLSSPERFDNHSYAVNFWNVFKKLGPLQPNEIYGFVPMLPMGGTRDLDYVQKVDAFAHLSILRQVTGDIRQMMEYADIYK